MGVFFKASLSYDADTIWLNASPAYLALASYHRFLSTTAGLAATIRKQKKTKPRDEYALVQAKARRDANLSRQAVLKEQRVKALGDPIRGIPTSFVKSFDTVAPPDVKKDATEVSLETFKANQDRPPPSFAHTSDQVPLNHGITYEEMAKTLESSRHLTEPVDIDRDNKLRQYWDDRHANAAESVRRIVSLTSGSSEHRTKKNIERVIDTFGRHVTEHVLQQKAPAAVNHQLSTSPCEPTPRIGPDTGSSEVQIGILTAKIRVLADRYEGENRNDKINKRNLRLLLHRRQKLLKYMERKERGSERWQHMIETLGLTPACWEGEIAVE